MNRINVALKPVKAEAHGKLPRLKSLVLPALLAAFATPGVHAQAGPATARAVVPGERLSDWMVRNPAAADDYLPGLIWSVPGEKPAQTGLRSALLLYLADQRLSSKVDPDARRRMQAWLSRLPVTGRALEPLADARWLQAHPLKDPYLAADHAVSVPKRPTTVTVIMESGQRCLVPHVAGHDARAYIAACTSDFDARWRVDTAWIAQPDGRTRRVGVALWNGEELDEPAPGAWIWAPQRGHGWTDMFATRLMEFLATQGSAPDTPAAVPDAINEDLLRPVGPSAWPHSPARSEVLSANDWGVTGLLQTPSARMGEAGNTTMTISRVYPYTRLSVILQPLDWLEAGFRYSTISDRPYGPSSLSGSQSYKDKSIDLKVRLVKESAFVPQVAVGTYDIGGTGLFSGEYLVANKRTGDFDWSLGLGWGYLGARGDLGNPLGWLYKGFNTRPAGVTDAGATSNFKQFFRGRTALFGGVQYQTPWKPLTVKLEYDGNDYKHEPQPFVGVVVSTADRKPQKTPINLGAVYQYSPHVDFSLGIERGNTAMLGVSIHGSLAKLETPKITDPKFPPVSLARPLTLTPDWAAVGREVAEQTDWDVRDIKQSGHDLSIVFENADATYWRGQIDRVIAVLHRYAPSDIDRFRLVYVQRGVPLAEHVVYRDAWVKDKVALLPPSERRQSLYVMPPRAPEPGQALLKLRPDPFDGGVSVNYSQNIGGPDGFILFQVGVSGQAEYHIDEHTFLSGNLFLRAFDNYNKFKYDAPSNLPRVRTYVREYLTTSRVTMPNFQLTHIGRLTDNQYYSVYGGYLESMFGGVGGEWLYRPMASHFAVGVDANYVKQRDFAQDFGFRDYHVFTGHATAYWDTGWNDVVATGSVGQYLAGDKGTTLALSRRFRNGVVMGAFATFTNVSKAQFGEGSFDKGIFVSIPFDAFLTKSSPFVGTFTWDPLTRDGGAKLNRAYPLYNQTNLRDRKAIDFGPPSTDDEP